jgi:predicted lipoprotein with Yx(FWY)xxD motif
MKQRKTFRAYSLAVVGLLALSMPAVYASMETVQTAQATVKGKTETVLANAQGMPLYYSIKDSSKQTKCTGNCTQYWPPLLLKSGQPSGPKSIQNELSTFHGANGRQVAYDGHPLYTSERDDQAGVAKGAGAGRGWHVATPELSRAGSGFFSTPPGWPPHPWFTGWHYPKQS